MSFYNILFLDFFQKPLLFKIFFYLFVHCPLISFQGKDIVSTFSPDLFCNPLLCSHCINCNYLIFYLYFSSSSGIAVISLLFSSTAFCPRQNPSSLLHAETMCDAFSSFLLFAHMVFPSIQMIFSTVPHHFCLTVPAISHKAAVRFQAKSSP